MSELDASYRSHPLLGVTRRMLWARMRGRRLPRMQGTLRLGGLTGELHVARDRWGIPHVEAPSAQLAAFGLGFCQGQDRSLQLSLLHAWSHARLSELVGSAGAAADEHIAGLGLARLSARLFPTLTPATQARFEAFADGINAGQRQGRSRRCPGHHLLRIHPRDFRGVSAFALALLRVIVLDCVRQFAGGTLPFEFDLLGYSRRGADETPRGPALWSSQIWTQDRASLPSPYYLAHLSHPGGTVAGVSWIGCPLFVVGHDTQRAWRPCTDSDSAGLGWRRQSEGVRARIYPRAAPSRDVRRTAYALDTISEAQLRHVCQQLSMLSEASGVSTTAAGAAESSPRRWIEFSSGGASLNAALASRASESLAPMLPPRPVTLAHPIGALRPRMAPAFALGPLIWRRGPDRCPALSYRIDASDPQSGRFSFPGGQSGNPLSDHYDDLVPTWLRGRGVPIVCEAQALAPLVAHELHLRGSRT